VPDARSTIAYGNIDDVPAAGATVAARLPAVLDEHQARVKKEARAMPSSMHWISPRGASQVASEGTEPDPRFTFANERTFLAWSRTSLALVVAGLGIVQLLPPFPGVPVGRYLLGLPLIILGAVLAVVAYVEWLRNQRALRCGLPLPRSILPWLLAATIGVMAVISALIVLLSATR
jgi:putative membrane protein